MNLFRLRPESMDYLHLDALRFIASAGIVAFHYKDWLSWPRPPLPLERLFGFSLFVDLFFVVSGMVMVSLYRDKLEGGAAYANFLGKRIARLGPLHWLTFAAFCLAAAVSQLGGRPTPLADWSCAAPTALMIHAFGACDRLSFNSASWSVSAEMAMYVALPATLALVRRPGWGWGLWVVILLLLAASDRVTPGEPWDQRTFDLGAVRALPAFLLGALVAARRDMLRHIPSPGALMWIAMALFVGLRWSDAPDPLRLATIYLIPVFALAADGRGRPGRPVRLLAPLGQLTYSVYMLHLPIAWVVLLVLAKRLALSGTPLNVLVVGTAVLIVPVASVLSLRLFETPARRWLTRRLHVNRAAAVEDPSAARAEVRALTHFRPDAAPVRQDLAAREP